MSPYARQRLGITLAAAAVISALGILGRFPGLSMLGTLPLFALVPVVLLGDPQAARANRGRVALAVLASTLWTGALLIFGFLATAFILTIPLTFAAALVWPVGVLGALRLGTPLRRFPLAALGFTLPAWLMLFKGWAAALSLLLADSEVMTVEPHWMRPEHWMVLLLLLGAAVFGAAAHPAQAPGPQAAPT